MLSFEQVGDQFFNLRMAISPNKDDQETRSALQRRLENNPPDLLDAKDRSLYVSLANFHEMPDGLEFLIVYDGKSSTGGRGRPGDPKSLSWDLATTFGKSMMHFQFLDIPLP